MHVTIREAVASDANAMGELASQFADYLRDLGDETNFRLTAEAILRDGFGANPAFKGLVAESDGHVIGYLLYHFGYDTDAAHRNLHMVDLYVDSFLRKQGVGQALVAAAMEIGRSAGAKEMIWSVFRANMLAEAFYARLGARRITELNFMALTI